MYPNVEERIEGKFYEKYRNSEIIFNRKTAADLGLVQGAIELKAGQVRIKSAILSASMEMMSLMIKVNVFQEKYINISSDLIFINLKFKDPFSKKEMSFNLETTLVEMKKHGYKKNGIYKIKLEIKQDIPHELQKIFIGFHERKLDICDMSFKKYTDRLLDTVLITDNKKGKCTPLKMNDKTLILNFSENPGDMLGKCAVIAIKHLESGYHFYIKGKINRDYQLRRTTCDLTLNYSMDQQCNRYRESFNVLRDIINL